MNTMLCGDSAKHPRPLNMVLVFGSLFASVSRLSWPESRLACLTRGCEAGFGKVVDQLSFSWPDLHSSASGTRRSWASGCDFEGQRHLPFAAICAAHRHRALLLDHPMCLTAAFARGPCAGAGERRAPGWRWRRRGAAARGGGRRRAGRRRKPRRRPARLAAGASMSHHEAALACRSIAYCLRSQKLLQGSSFRRAHGAMPACIRALLCICT